VVKLGRRVFLNAQELRRIATDGLPSLRPTAETSSRLKQ
jgi:hypothetical protein